MEIIHENDVLCGRGKGAYNHPGNCIFRKLVALNKKIYAESKRKEKVMISKAIVQAIQSQDPPGKFLDYDPSSCSWNEITDLKATEKTSQALRKRINENENFFISKYPDMLVSSCRLDQVQSNDYFSSDVERCGYNSSLFLKSDEYELKEYICNPSLKVEKSLKESCSDMEINDEELDALIFQTFKDNLPNEVSKFCD